MMLKLGLKTANLYLTAANLNLVMLKLYIFHVLDI